MIVIGITGLIASGKSTVLNILYKISTEKNNTTYIFNSDDFVAKLMHNSEVILQLSKAFPSSYVNNIIDKNKLKQELSQDYFTKIKILENIFHPLVKQEIKKIILENIYKVLILEVPLLFEASINELCNYIILLKASKKIRTVRVLSRQGITKEQLNNIMYKQEHIDVDFATKEAKASLILNTEDSIQNVSESIENFFTTISK